MGAADYLTKPFNPAILGARINASLSAKRLRDLELEYLDRQSATNEVLRAISRSAFDLDTLLTSVIDTAGRLCRAEYAVIYLADGNLFYPAATARASAELVDFFRTNPISVDRHSLVGRVALTGNAVAIPDVLADPEYRTSEAQSIGGWRSAPPARRTSTASAVSSTLDGTPLTPPQPPSAFWAASSQATPRRAGSVSIMPRSR